MAPITISIQATSLVFDHKIMAKKAASAPVLKVLTIRMSLPASIDYSIGILEENGKLEV